MVWINKEHRNEPAPPGGFGGSMCTCADCVRQRVPRELCAHGNPVNQCEVCILTGHLNALLSASAPYLTRMKGTPRTQSRHLKNVWKAASEYAKDKM